MLNPEREQTLASQCSWGDGIALWEKEYEEGSKTRSSVELSRRGPADAWRLKWRLKAEAGRDCEAGGGEAEEEGEVTWFLGWLWFRREQGWRVVKAIDWTEMLIDDRGGQRMHVWIENPPHALLCRFGLLKRRMW